MLRRIAQCGVALVLSAALLTCGCSTVSGSRRDVNVSRQALPAPVVVERLEDRSASGRPGLDHDLTALLIASLVDQPTLDVAAPAEDRDFLDRLRRTRNDFWPPARALKTLTTAHTGDAFVVSGHISEFASDAKRGQARVTLRLQLRDPESGRTLASITGSGSARARRSREQQALPQFGSEAFFASPLGQATRNAVAQASRVIVARTPNIYWEPLVAGTSEERIILNGGRDRGFREGQTYTVYGPGENITDPITGRILTTVSGQAVGQIRVTQVGAQVAFATPLKGGPFKRMQRLSTQARR